MKSKRELLEHIAKYGRCEYIRCTDCPYDEHPKHCLYDDLRKIGAMAILRQNRKKRGLTPNKVLTCVTADKAKVGMRGYFADNISTLKQFFKNNNVCELKRVLDEDTLYRFESSNYIAYALFYPIDEVEE